MNLSKVSTITDLVQRSSALKNAFIKLKDDACNDFSEALGLACHLVTFKEMPHTWKDEEIGFD